MFFSLLNYLFDVLFFQSFRNFLDLRKKKCYGSKGFFQDFLSDERMEKLHVTHFMSLVSFYTLCKKPRKPKIFAIKFLHAFPHI